MVGVATGAGLSVKGSLDTSMIERGFDRVRQSFESVKAQSKSFTADLIRMETSSANLVKQLNRVGIIGVSAIIGLASQAPAVAGSMAKISVQTDRLIRTLGKQFAPEFSKVSDMYTKFVNLVEANPDLTKAFVFSSTAVAGFTAAKTFLGAISGVIIPVGLAGILTSIAAIVAAGAVGWTLGDWLGEKTYDSIGKDVVESMIDIGERDKDWIGKSSEIFGDAIIKFFKGLIGTDAVGNPDLE